MNTTEWTIATLHEYLERIIREKEERYLAIFSEKESRYNQKFDDQERALLLSLDAATKAVTKAEIATEKRFESVNEFRGTLSDQSNRMMPRVESEQRHQATNDRFISLQSRLDKIEGRTGGLSAGWIVLVQIISTFIAIVSVVLAVNNTFKIHGG